MAKRQRRYSVKACPFCKVPLVRKPISLRWVHPEPDNCVSLERARHDEIVRVDRLVDADGRAASPLRSKTMLVLLHERGTIDDSTLLSGELFHEKFYQACFSPLQAVNLLGNVRAGRSKEDGMTAHVRRAQDYVMSRILHMGGQTSFAGSCAWNVVGLGHSVQHWVTHCTLPAPINPPAGKGILIAVLNMLAADPDAAKWTIRHSTHSPGLPSPKITAALQIRA